jgi:hypothetical protein
MSVQLIIDCDPIVYRCGFASEQNDYHVVAEDAAGKLHEKFFQPTEQSTAGDQMKAWVADKTVLTKEKVVTPKPLEECLEIVATELLAVVKATREKFKLTRAPAKVVLLSGPDNFRYKVAKLKPYKGNRLEDAKPHHYQAIRNYLSQDWDAKVIHGREADDECSILAHQLWDKKDYDGFAIATIDKDLDQIPGHHYDYAKHVWYFVGDTYAKEFFWRQCLSGDATDNIGGVHKLGSKGAEKLVRGYCDNKLSDEDIWQEIVLQYEDSKKKAGCSYVSVPSHEVALETARLVYMQQHEGELWNPPGIPVGKLGELK